MVHERVVIWGGHRIAEDADDEVAIGGGGPMRRIAEIEFQERSVHPEYKRRPDLTLGHQFSSDPLANKHGLQGKPDVSAKTRNNIEFDPVASLLQNSFSTRIVQFFSNSNYNKQSGASELFNI